MFKGINDELSYLNSPLAQHGSDYPPTHTIILNSRIQKGLSFYRSGVSLCTDSVQTAWLLFPEKGRYNASEGRSNESLAC